jgi:outer membrane protein assembly factor BamD (BamD/ComL family)
MGMIIRRLGLSQLFGAAFIILLLTGCSSKEPSKGEIALFDLAAKAQAANDFNQALDTYQRIAEEFPSSPRLDKALFMVGFIKYENFHDTANATVAFQQVVDKFPKSDLCDDAQFMLETIKTGQDPLTTLQKKIK